MTWGAVAGAAVGVVGGLLNDGSSTGTQTQTREIDPRLAPYIYGTDGNGGILADAQALYNANKSGYNQQMLDGWNRQYQIYSDPNVAAGYSQIASTGLGLLGGGAASNPFSTGQASLQVPRPTMLNQGAGGVYQPSQSAGSTQSPNAGLLGASSPVTIGNPATMGGASGGQMPFQMPAAPAQAPVAGAPAPVTDDVQRMLADWQEQEYRRRHNGLWSYAGPNPADGG